jgi:hypothetical protein
MVCVVQYYKTSSIYDNSEGCVKLTFQILICSFQIQLTEHHFKCSYYTFLHNLQNSIPLTFGGKTVLQ